MGGIYKITNLINGKVYIGQSQDIKQRWREHRSASEKEDNVLYLAMRKYGIDNFSFEILEECPIEELNEKEIYYIEKFNSYIHAENSNGYNMTLGGDTSRGYRHSDEARRKIGESNKGRKMTEYNKMKLIEAHKGKSLTEKHKEKISKNHADVKGEKHPMYGKNHSEEAKRKMSENHANFKGGNSARARRVYCDNREFDCVGDCAKFYNLKRATLGSWLRGDRKMPQEFVDKGLKYIERKVGD